MKCNILSKELSTQNCCYTRFLVLFVCFLFFQIYLFLFIHYEFGVAVLELRTKYTVSGSVTEQRLSLDSC